MRQIEDAVTEKTKAPVFPPEHLAWNNRIYVRGHSCQCRLYLSLKETLVQKSAFWHTNKQLQAIQRHSFSCIHAVLSGPSVQPHNQQRIKQLNEKADIHIDRPELCVRNTLLFTASNNQANHMHDITFPSAESDGFCHGGKPICCLQL